MPVPKLNDLALKYLPLIKSNLFGHFDIRLFYIKGLVDRGEVSIEYCPTEDMIADFMTKPTVGKKFKMLREYIMNLHGKDHRVVQQECVGQVKHESMKTRDGDMVTESDDRPGGDADDPPEQRAPRRQRGGLHHAAYALLLLFGALPSL